jgi:glycosyltransferase involved in cell wall biosynthesis
LEADRQRRREGAMTVRPSLSVCIITLDEERNLPRCLRSVARLASEVIVVDSGSRDRTREIAAAAGAKVVEQAFLGHVKQKQTALDLASEEWVLSLDADEWLGEDLGEEIAETLASEPPQSVAGYELNRQPFYLGRWIRHSGWFPEWKLRLVRRRRARWAGFDPHDRLEVSGSTRRLSSPLKHYPHVDLSDHTATINRYTDIIAGHWRPTSTLRAVTGMVIEAPLVFVQKYILQGGFRDGVRGLTIAAMTSFYFFLRYAKLWERDHGSGDPRDD